MRTAIEVGLRRPRRTIQAGSAPKCAPGKARVAREGEDPQSRAGDHAGLWPIAGAQLAALAVGGPLMAHRLRAGAGGGWRVRGAPLRWLVIAGMLDMTANALYLLAVRGGDLSIIAPIASLYPVSTVLLAMLVDGERMRPVQLAGLGLAATALVLVAS